MLLLLNGGFPRRLMPKRLADHLSLADAVAAGQFFRQPFDFGIC
jgi:hypothetical protein